MVGVGSHIPEVLALVEEQGWDVDFYAGCVYNRRRTPEELRKLLGGELPEMPIEVYLQDDPPRMYKVFRQTKKPCVAFKIMAAGRVAQPGSGLQTGVPEHQADRFRLRGYVPAHQGRGEGERLLHEPSRRRVLLGRESPVVLELIAGRFKHRKCQDVGHTKGFLTIQRDHRRRTGRRRIFAGARTGGRTPIASVPDSDIKIPKVKFGKVEISRLVLGAQPVLWSRSLQPAS